MGKKFIIAFLAAHVSLIASFSQAADSSCHFTHEFQPFQTPAGWKVDYGSPLTTTQFSFSKNKTYRYVATIYSNNPNFHYQHFICLYQEKDCKTNQCPAFTLVSPTTFSKLTNPALYDVSSLPNLPPHTQACQPSNWKNNPNAASHCIF